jgi:hypothetical protein
MNAAEYFRRISKSCADETSQRGELIKAKSTQHLHDIAAV